MLGSNTLSALIVAMMILLSSEATSAADDNFRISGDGRGGAGEHFDVSGVGGECWVPPEGRSCAVLLCLHGVSMWSASFENLAKQMFPMQVAIYSMDVLGFGPGARENHQWKKTDPKASLGKIVSVLHELHLRHPGKPLFLLGESMGGSFAIRVAALYPSEVAGIIASAPAWRVQQRRYMLSRLLLSSLLRRKCLSDKIAVDLMNRATDDPQLVERWRTLPLYRRQFSTSEILAGLHFFGKTGSYARRVDRTPVLMVQGLNDRLVKSKGTATLFRRITTQDKELVIVGHSQHLIFQEVDPDHQLVRLVVEWMKWKMQPESCDGLSSGYFMGSAMTKKAKHLFDLAAIEHPVVLDPGLLTHMKLQLPEAWTKAQYQRTP